VPMSVFALNLFDLAENDLYRQYSRRSVDAVGKHGGRVVALGKLSTDASAGVPVSILSAAFAHGVCSVSREWAGLDSNQGATDYESAALPLSYRPAGREASRSRQSSTLPAKRLKLAPWGSRRVAKRLPGVTSRGGTMVVAPSSPAWVSAASRSATVK
jgi:hypothetical protein